MSRLAILKDYRGKGYSNQLMGAVDDYVRKQKEGPIDESSGGKAIKLQLNAQVRSRGNSAHEKMQVIPFYEKLGWTQEGDVFDEEGGKWSISSVRSLD